MGRGIAKSYMSISGVTAKRNKKVLFSKEELLNRSAKVKTLADRFIDTKKIDKLLSQFGSITYTGSYDCDLMVWNDIDIQISLNNYVERVEQFTKIAALLLEDPEVKNIKLMNFEKFKKNNMPSGMYMGINFSLRDSVSWKVDIWCLNPGDQKINIDFSKEIKSKINENNRLLVLDWKFRLMGDSSRVPQMASYILYQGIIIKGLRSEIDIINFLQENGVNYSHS